MYFGYYYHELKLTDRIIYTLYLLLFWLVIEAAFVRGLSVAARRLAYQRALTKRAAAKEGLDGEVITEEPTLDIEQVNQQSLRLIRLALLGGFIAEIALLAVHVGTLVVDDEGHVDAREVAVRVLVRPEIQTAAQDRDVEECDQGDHRHSGLVYETKFLQIA